MTTSAIYIDPNAFTAGKPLYGVDPIKARVMVGNVDTNNNINGGGVGIHYSSDPLNLIGRNSITVTVNVLTVETTQLTRWPQNWKNSLADLVSKGVIVVESPAGSVLTSSAIVAL